MIQTNRNAYSTRQTQVWAISAYNHHAHAMHSLLWVCAWCSLHVVRVVVMPRWFFSVKWFSRGVKINFFFHCPCCYDRIVHMNLNMPAEPHNTKRYASQMTEKKFLYLLITPLTMSNASSSSRWSHRKAKESLYMHRNMFNVSWWSCVTLFRYFHCGECVFTLNETLPASVSNVTGFVSFTCGCTGISNSLTTYLYYIFAW